MKPTTTLRSQLLAHKVGKAQLVQQARLEQQAQRVRKVFKA
jgi:hypothetical protein